MSSLIELMLAGDMDGFTQLVHDRQRNGYGLEDADGYGRTALSMAVEFTYTEMIRVLLEAGADPNTARFETDSGKDDWSPLLLAAKYIPKFVKMLLDHGADVNYRSSFFLGQPHTFSALDVVCEKGRWEAARWLVEAGADMSPPSIRFEELHTVAPLMLVAESGPAKLVQLMLEKGADPNYVASHNEGCEDDRTALHFACGGNADVETIRLLVEWGADVNPIPLSDDGPDPLLHTAVDSGASPAAVSALVMAGADTFGVNYAGRTVVEEKGEEDVLLDSRPC